MIDYPTVEHHAPYSAQISHDLKIDDYFGTVFVINLPTASERLAVMQKTLQAIGVTKFEILVATNGRQDVEEHLWRKMDRNWRKIDLSTPGGQQAFDKQRQAETGCYLSHLRIFKIMQERYVSAQRELKDAKSAKNPKAIKQAKEKLEKNSRVLILEDDNDFGLVKGFRRATLTGVSKIFRSAMKELPSDWDMLYFMALSLHKPAERYSSHLAKLNYGLCLNAYAVNHPMYPVLIKHLEKIFDPAVHHVEPVDAAIADLHKNYRCYAITPSIAYQREGLSSITSGNQQHYRQERPIRHH